ncbi:MAG: bifunctional histidinol-phosphatase/imidazoleglycerol-phosphate dehydratase HisB [Bacteroidales bacterium]|nr:bifunctional histidinol-phosphatase/imidazoleglycerol-phosphate dehydratase HisB [Bacteroidales bacterium]
MTKVLFIDRDGTLIHEPPEDFQIDSLEKLEYIPGVFRYLSLIAEELEYELVIVSNQDGLGTAAYPESAFELIQKKMLKAFSNEGIEFSDILIDKSFAEDNLPTRKPGTGMLTKYIQGGYDLVNSFVIGDRLTDIELAQNLGCKGILFASEDRQGYDSQVQALQTDSWKTIYEFLRFGQRTASVQRNTNETQISIKLNLDGTGKSDISTGIGFFDHMLDQLSRHGSFDLSVQTRGDLQVDEHHTIEDTALALGQAFKEALGDKRGICRYGFTIPMDDSLATVTVDFGGRNWLVWNAEFNREKIGEMPTEMFFHFFKSFSDKAECNLNISATGDNEHHKIEAIFKAFARALKMAVQRDKKSNQLPTTKGIL